MNYWQTKIDVVFRRDWQALCGTVAALIPSLQWRHNGIGALQAYIHEGAENEMRVHIWHRKLRREGIEESGLLHNHRFDMDSVVLAGTILQDEYQIAESPKGDHVLYEVLHARAAAENRAGAAIEGAPFHHPPTRLPGCYSTTNRLLAVRESHRYFFPKRAFHGTDFSHKEEMTITLVTKSDQDRVPARILAPADKPIVHAFESPLPFEAWADLLLEAQALLLQKAGMR